MIFPFSHATHLPHLVGKGLVSLYAQQLIIEDIGPFSFGVGF